MTDNLKVLILDEPTSALSTDKAEQLHRVVKELSGKGIAVIYISHKLDEIRKVSDRIVLMRNGMNSGECSPDEITTAGLVELLEVPETGRKRRRIRERGTYRRDVGKNKRLYRKGLYKIDMYVNKGEIVGISGLVGSGQTELRNLLFDSRKLWEREERCPCECHSLLCQRRQRERGSFPSVGYF